MDDLRSEVLLGLSSGGDISVISPRVLPDEDPPSLSPEPDGVTAPSLNERLSQAQARLENRLMQLRASYPAEAAGTSILALLEDIQTRSMGKNCFVDMGENQSCL